MDKLKKTTGPTRNGALKVENKTMADHKEINNFLGQCSEDIFDNVLKIREIVLKNRPEVQE